MAVACLVRGSMRQFCEHLTETEPLLPSTDLEDNQPSEDQGWTRTQ